MNRVKFLSDCKNMYYLKGPDAPVSLEYFGYSEELTESEKVNVFNAAVSNAREKNKLLVLFNKTYDFGKSKIKLDEIKIIGTGIDTVFKCTADLGSNVVIENMTVHATDHWTLPYYSHSDNFIAKNILFKANGALKGGFFLNDATATNYKFIDCDFVDGMCIALVCKCTNDMYMENFHFIRCNFTFPSHFSCIGSRKTEGVKMERGWKNIKLEYCNLIGSTTPETDYDITFTVDTPDLVETLETELYGISPISDGLTVDHCNFYNGFFSFENAGANNVVVSNCVIINNNSGYNAISQSRLENYKKLNIEYRNNYISGRCHFVGSTRLINNVFDSDRIEVTYGNFTIDKCHEIGHIYQENSFLRMSSSSFSENKNSDDSNKIFLFGGDKINRTFISNSSIPIRDNLNTLFENITDKTDVVISNSYCEGYTINDSGLKYGISLSKKTMFNISANKRLKICIKPNDYGGIEDIVFNFEWISRENNNPKGSSFSLYAKTYNSKDIK